MHYRFDTREPWEHGTVYYVNDNGEATPVEKIPFDFVAKGESEWECLADAELVMAGWIRTSRWTYIGTTVRRKE